VVDVHAQTPETPGPQLIEQSELLEQQLQALAGEMAEIAVGLDESGLERGQVVGGELEREVVARGPPRPQRRFDAAEPFERELLFGERLDDPARGEPGEEAGGIAPGTVAVASGQQDDQREPLFPTAGQVRHERVPRPHPFGCDLPIAERVVRRGVRPRDVHDEVGAEHLEHRGQRGLERPQVERVVDVRAQGDRGRLHRLRVPPGLVVDRERMDARVSSEESTGTVAVVQVQIDHQHPPAVAAGARLRDGDGDVVEDAEPLAAIGEGVVEAAPEVHPHAPRPERPSQGLDGSPHHQALQVDRPLGLVGRHLDAEDASEDAGILEALEVLGGVDAEQALKGRRAGLREDAGS
jgi:hypothetical protein